MDLCRDSLVENGDPPALLGRQSEFDSSRHPIVTPKREPPSNTLRRNYWLHQREERDPRREKVFGADVGSHRSAFLGARILRHISDFESGRLLWNDNDISALQRNILLQCSTGGDICIVESQGSLHAGRAPQYANILE